MKIAAVLTLRSGRFYETKYNRDIYDLVFIPEGVTSGTVRLQFGPEDPKSGLPTVVKTVDL